MGEAPRELTRGQRLGYGLGSVAYSLPYQAAASLTIFYATEILGIPPAVAGLAGMLAAITDAAADPVVGILSDRSSGGPGRLGRRHGYLLAGGLGAALFSALLWAIPPGMPLPLRVPLFFLLLVLLKSALAVFYVPYLALGAELSDDYDQRSLLQAIRSAFYVVGMLVALVAAPILFFRQAPGFPKGQMNPAAYPAMGLVFALLTGGCALASVGATRSRIPFLGGRAGGPGSPKLSPASFVHSVRNALANRHLALLAAMILVVEAGVQVGINVGYHVNTYTYGLTGPRIGLAGLVVLGFSVLSQPLWVWGARRFEKRALLAGGVVMAACGFIGAPWALVWWRLVPAGGESFFAVLLAFMAVAGAGNGAFLSIPASMLADAVDEHELRTGRREEGLFFGVYMLAYKVGTAVAWALAGLLLARIGFVPGAAAQTPPVCFRLAMWPTVLMAATLPPTFFLISRYGLTRRKWAEVQAALGK